MLDLIKLSTIFNDPEVVEAFPASDNENAFPTVIYSLNQPIRSKLLNHKDTVADINSYDVETLGTGIHQCNCAGSEFCDPNHGHIITGNLQIIENSKLRQLMSKGPNYREPRTVNWRKCRLKILEALDEFIVANSRLELESWKTVVLSKVDTKIDRLQANITPRHTNTVLQQPAVKQYLEKLQKHFVVVPIDKASNNIAIICKRFYAEVLLKEVGKLDGISETYVSSGKSINEILHNDFLHNDRYGLKVGAVNSTLPSMYWMPKMHKTPIGFRFIVASSTCSTKPLSKTVSSIFKLIYNQTENFHSSAKFLSNYNKFWVLKDASPITDIIKKVNSRGQANTVSTFDFSTLYTKLPHGDLVHKLSEIVDLVFEGGKHKYIRISKNGNAY